MKVFSIARYDNWRDRVVMLAYYIARVLDAFVYVCSLSMIHSDLGAFVVFSDWYEEWPERERPWYDILNKETT